MGPTVDESAATAMSAAEVEDFLTTRGQGVLSLSDGGDAYSVPMSFGYDGTNLLFQFAADDDSRKVAYLEATETASFVAYSFDSVAEWASVVVRGPVSPVPSEERESAYESLASNASFPTLDVFGAGLSDEDFELYQLEPTERTGMKGQNA